MRVTTTNLIRCAEFAVHYTGTLDDGTQFDCSREKGRPLTFKVGGGRVRKRV